jgi:penicillin-binding protein 1A
VISAETSTILNKLLQRVANGPNGTGTRASLNSVGYITAGKTGSASENTDLWFVGMTPYYLGATWMGYTEGMQEVLYSTYPTPIIWHDVMLKVHQGLDTDKDFPISNNVVSATYCTETGDSPPNIAPPPRLAGIRRTTCRATAPSTIPVPPRRMTMRMEIPPVPTGSSPSGTDGFTAPHFG